MTPAWFHLRELHTLGSHTDIAAKRFVGELVSLYPRFEKQAYAKFDMTLFIQIIMKV